MSPRADTRTCPRTIEYNTKITTTFKCRCADVNRTATAVMVTTSYLTAAAAISRASVQAIANEMISIITRLRAYYWWAQEKKKGGGNLNGFRKFMPSLIKKKGFNL